MKGLEIIAEKVTRRLREENCVATDHRLKLGGATEAILETYPVWLMVYSMDSPRALYINKKMAEFIGVPAGFIKTEDEYRTVHNCDITTAHNRFLAFEYYMNGGKGARKHVGIILSPEDCPVIVNDLACPIVVDNEGRAVVYAHFYKQQNGPSIVNAYALGDLDRLTPRQRQVMECLLQDLPPPRIVERLRITQKTLDKHVAAILTITGQPHVRALWEKCAISDE